VEELLKFQFLGNPLRDWAIALAIFLVTFAVLPFASWLINTQRRRLGARAPLNVNAVMDLAALLAKRSSSLFIWGAAIWLASRDLAFPGKYERWLTLELVVLLWMQIAIWSMAAVRFAIDRRRQTSTGPDTLLKSSMEVILFAAGIVIWGVAALLALDNLGVEIRPLLAGLGIGGIALALAVQTVLADLLASLSIALDKPFGLGDSLTVGECSGTVEHIGVKSTRLRSVDGEQIIISNGDLVKARVRNLSRLTERRSLFVMQVHYETPVATLAAVPRAVREIIEATPDVRFERCHLLRCTATALEIEAVYWVTRADYKAYADAQQSINLNILERFRTMEVQFVATAPQTMVLHPPPGPQADASGQQHLL
jgi:small-conductance mechanosensitive channel